MSKLDVIQEGHNLCININFKDSLKPANLKGTIPLKIRGFISGLKINDKICSVKFKADNIFSLLDIPFSEVKSGKLTLSMIVQPNTQ